jgi:DNA-binding phage protein
MPDMTLTRDFKDTIRTRAARDMAFRSAMLSEAVDLLLQGDVATGRAVLRDFINATVGFDALAAQTGKPAKSIMRMVGPSGNPTAQNLFDVISQLQKATGVQLSIQAA